MRNLNTVEIKAFVPARDFELSQRFYEAMGFRIAFSDAGLAYLHAGDCSFLLQNFYVEALAGNFMMHLLVEDADAWYDSVVAADLTGRFPGTRLVASQDQPWGMRDFAVVDPSGVLWRIAHNLPKTQEAGA
ncbi:MAG TPA: VOC family protein [Roseateles sp.]|nr:VOC family protein [Roseateles sp.]